MANSNLRLTLNYTHHFQREEGREEKRREDGGGAGRRTGASSSHVDALLVAWRRVKYAKEPRVASLGNLPQ